MGTFEFKQFAVKDDNCAMKIGTDSILLVSWISKNQTPNNILDIGSGSGILSLMCAQKFQNSKIISVEIDENACSDSLFNFNKSLWKNNFVIQNIDLVDFKSEIVFDLIVCNPPYFYESFKSTNVIRNVARHLDNLTLEILAKKVNEFLSDNGFFYVVFPNDNFKDLVFELGKNGLFLQSKCEVRNSNESSVKRILACFGKKYLAKIEIDELILRNKFGYTPEFKSLTSEYYLEKAYFNNINL